MTDENLPAEPRDDTTLPQAEEIDEQALWDKLIAESEGGKPESSSAEPEAKAEAEPDADAKATEQGEAGAEAEETIDALRSERDYLRQYHRSNEGRVAALTRKIAAYEAKLAELSKPQAKQEVDIFAPALEKARRSKEDFPEVVEPFVELVEAMQTREKQQQAAMKAEQESRRQAEFQQQQAAMHAEELRLRQAMPAYDDFLKTHGPDFAAWAQTDAPVAIHNMVMENADAIRNADRAMYAINAYLTARGMNTAPQAHTDEPRQPATNTGQSRRERQLAAGASLSDGRRPSLADDASDEEALWNEITSKRVVFKP